MPAVGLRATVLAALWSPGLVLVPSRVSVSMSASEFDLNRGRALDVLKSDCESFFDRPLTWDIYDSKLRLREPSGIEVCGLGAYKSVFAAIRAVRRVAADEVCVSRTRTCYDDTRRVIVVQWYSQWHWRMFGTTSLDAVSTFHLDDAGRVFRHDVDKLVVNRRDSPAPVTALVAPPALATTLFRAETDDDDGRRRTEKKQPTTAKGGFLGKCEFMWDCEFPLECCNFGLVKVCCGGGGGLPIPLSPVPIPIPVPVDPPRPPSPPAWSARDDSL